MISAVRLAGFLAVVVGVAIGFADEKPKASTDRTAGTISSREAAQTALTELNGLIGTWRGVGQPVRNSNKGSWTESAEWVWDLKSEQVSIRLSVKDGKLLRSGLLTWDADKKEYQFQATLPDQSQRTYRGALASKKLTLETVPGETGEIQQLVVTPLNEKRTLLMFQAKGKGQQQFNRVARGGHRREKPADESFELQARGQGAGTGGAAR